MTSSFEVCSNNRNDLYWSNTHKLMPVCEMCFVMSLKLILVSVGKENTLLFFYSVMNHLRQYMKCCLQEHFEACEHCYINEMKYNYEFVRIV